MTYRRLLWQIPFLAFLIAASVAIIRGQRNAPYQHSAGTVFGTTYHITYQCDSNLTQSIEAELRKVDFSLSPFNERSVISAVNRGEDVHVDEMFSHVFQLAERVSQETGGAFDITVAPLVNAWGFGFKNGAMPSDAQVDSLRQIVGYHKVRLTADHRISKDDPRLMLDCSAIAKGYGSDVVARLLRTRGVKNFMVEIGGEIVAQGESDKRAPWRIGVTKPTDDSLSQNQELQTVLSLTDCAMATSGNYRNFYYKDGKKYAHTIDPKTGRPVQHNILSSTVVARDCATADAYATSFMVLGLDGAKDVLARHTELMAYFIYADAEGKLQVWFSPELEKRIQP